MLEKPESSMCNARPFAKKWNAALVQLIILLIAVSNYSYSQSPISIQTPSFDYRIQPGESMWVLEDTELKLEIEQIIKNESFSSELTGPNYPNSAYWMKVKVRNTTDRDAIMMWSHRNMSYFSVYQTVEDSIIDSSHAGIYQPKSKLRQGDTGSDIRMNLRPGNLSVFYLKIYNTRDYGAVLRVRLSDQESYFQRKIGATTADFAFFGAVFVLVLYSLTQFLLHHHRNYLWLFIFTLGLGLYALSLRNYFMIWFFPENAMVGKLFTSFWTQVAHVGMLLLFIEFYELKRKNQKWFKAFNILLIWTGLRTITALALTVGPEKYVLMTEVVQWSMIPDTVICALYLLKHWKSMNMSQKTFGIAIWLFIVGFILIFLAFHGFFFADRIVAAGISATSSLLEVIVFSVAIGFQLRQHEKDKNNALAELNLVQLEQKNKIEQQVVERTAEIQSQKVLLEERNERIETLFKEVHHRVKNNLQIVSSLLNMQQEWSSSQSPKRAIEDSRSRVVAMSVIHQFLYKTEDVHQIGFKAYAEELVNKLDAIQTKKTKYKLFTVFDDDYMFDIDTSISLGLILNELVTNSYKHAAEAAQTLEIVLSMNCTNDFWLLTYQDNGQKMAVPFEEAVKKGFGLRLSSRLARQLRGNLRYDYEGGNQFRLKFLVGKSD